MKKKKKNTPLTPVVSFYMFMFLWIIIYYYYYYYYYYHYYYFVFILFHLFYLFILFYYFFLYQLIVLLVTASFSTARLYQEIRTSKAKGVATEDYSLPRFIGLGRAVGGNTKQFPGTVHMDKRQCTATSQMFMDKLFAYLRGNLSLNPATLRKICLMGCCTCKSGLRARCGPCEC